MPQSFSLKDIGNGIGYPFCIFDAAESMVYCNDEFERTLGVKDLIGLTLSAGFEETEFRPIVRGVRECLAGRKSEVSTLTIDGFPVRYFQAIVKPIQLGPEVKFAVCTLADITAKMESLNFAEQAKEFYNRVFDGLPQAYILVGEDYSILRSNDSAAQLFQYEKNLLLGMNLSEIVAGSNNEPIDLIRAHAVNPGPIAASKEMNGMKRDGSTFPIRISFIPGNLFGIATYSVIILDLTADRDQERKKLDQERKSHAMMRNEALGKLAGKFAHDMNNVLAIIGGYGEILSTTVRAEDEQAVDEINRGVKRAANLTARILAYTGRQQLETRPLNMSVLLAGSKSLWSDTLGDTITVKLDIAEETIVALADEKLLMQVVLSLLANCREAITEGGNVTIGLRAAILDADFFKARGIEALAGKYAEIFVKDDGSGIPADKQAMVFEPYFSTKDPNKSSGLGLAIVYGIIKQHHGFIFCESIPDKETVMRIFLPSAEGDEAWEEPDELFSAIHPPDFAVLVVDDEEPILRLLESALTSRGFKVFTAEDGRQALDFLETHEGRIDLLISDIMMPEVSGIELAQSALQSYPNLPVIFITGYSQQIIDQNPVLRHFPVIAKPFSPAEIVKAAEREIALRIRPPEVQDYSLPE